MSNNKRIAFILEEPFIDWHGAEHSNSLQGLCNSLWEKRGCHSQQDWGISGSRSESAALTSGHNTVAYNPAPAQHTLAEK